MQEFTQLEQRDGGVECTCSTVGSFTILQMILAHMPYLLIDCRNLCTSGGVCGVCFAALQCVDL